MSLASKLHSTLIACGLMVLAVPLPVAAEGTLAEGPGRRTPGEITHIFRHQPVGDRPGAVKSGWRIKWTVIDRVPGHEMHREHEYGRAAVLELTSVEFMQGTDAGAEGPWTKILSNLALSELYSFYNAFPERNEGPADGPPQQETFDISDNSYGFARFDGREGLSRLGFGPLPAPSSAEVVSADGVVVKEVRDDGIRAVWWLTDGQPSFVAVRGEVLSLWALQIADNYFYIIEYSFADDGSIRVRLGATGHNYYQHRIGSNSAVHQHFGCWRMTFATGTSTTVNMLENIVTSDRTRARIARRRFNNGREGGEVWAPDRFGSLEVQISSDTRIPTAYVLVPRRTGSGRAGHLMTDRDFWVTVQDPRNATRQRKNQVRNAQRAEKDLSERRCSDVPAALSRGPETLSNHSLVIWHQSAFLHVPRREDFGATPVDPHTALTAWTGFDLVPHNLWEKTPFLKSPSQ